MTAEIHELHPMLHHALAYAARGWHLAPVYEIAGDECSCKLRERCTSPGKHPRLFRNYKPSNEDERIRTWWQQWPTASIALHPGPSNLIVLDVDPRNGGDATLAELEREHGELPECPMAVTGGGGWHFVFARPDTETAIRSGVLGPGVEVKADTGYVILSPSRHISGREYTWDAGRDLDTVIPGCPAWILRELADERRASVARQMDPGGPEAGLMGAAFAAAGMSERQLGPDKMSVTCPWNSDHTTGRPGDGSTIVFAPTLGHKFGWFHCSHAHCSSREQAEVLAMLPETAVDAARRQLSMDPDASPRQRFPDAEPAPAAKAAAALPWQQGLRITHEGRLTKDPGNAALILANDAAWAGTLRYEELGATIEWAARPPALPGLPRPDVGRFRGDDYLYIQHWFARVRGASFAREGLVAAVASAAKVHKYDVLVDYLNGLRWDGQKRLDTWLTDHFGVLGTNYVSFVGRAWLISAIARGLDPGCQADHVLVLEGDQGLGKSTALYELASPWYLPQLPSVLNKDSLVVLGGIWIANIEELSGISAADDAHIKAFLTQRHDVYRPPYEAAAVNRPRRCVFSATTNRNDWIHDSTGGRRYWPVKCGVVSPINSLGVRECRDQLWAEALVAYQAGEKWHNTDAALADAMRCEQLARAEEDSWSSRIIERLDAYPERSWDIGELMTSVLMIESGKQTRGDARRVGAILRRHYYVRARIGANWRWMRGDEAKWR